MRSAAFAVTAAMLLIATCAAAQTTQPASDQAGTSTGATTQPSVATPSPEQLLNQMLRGGDSQKNQVLTPDSAGPRANSDPSAAGLAPDAPAGAIMREGTEILDRVGRLQKSTDGQWQQFVFESDGRAMKDPPIFVLPNLTLMLMEKELNSVNHDLRFRITGTVTEYHGHNYILLEKVVVLQDKNQEF